MIDMRREPEGDILFVRFSKEPVSRTVMREPDIMVDVDAAGKPISLEVIGVRHTPFEAVVAVLDEFGLEISQREFQTH